VSYKYIRGIPAVEQAIQHLEAGTGKPELKRLLAKRKPAPMAPAAIEQLRIAGQPLPPSLKRWLAHNSSSLGWDFKQPLEGMPFDSFILQALKAIGAKGSRKWTASFAAIGRGKLRGRCFPLPTDPKAGAVYWLYVGKADSSGEYPVLWYDTDLSPPHIDLGAADFGEWLLGEAGPYRGWDDIPAEQADASRRAARKWHEKNNLGAATIAVDDF
jgi:hypothetical protein